MSPLKRWICTTTVLSVTVVSIFGCIFVKLFLLSSDSCEDCSNVSVSSPEKLRTFLCRRPCTTKDCVLTASELIDSMDNEKNDPCVDFHLYSCGSRVEYPEYDNKMRSVSEYSFYLSLRNAINDISDESIMPVRQLKKFYDHCVDFQSSEMLTVPGLLKLLGEIGLFGWPHLTQNWNFQKNNGERVSLDVLIGNLEMVSAHSFLMITFHVNENRTHGALNGKIAVDVKLEPSKYVRMKKEHINPKDHREDLILHKEAIISLFDLLDVGADDVEIYATGILELEAAVSYWLNQSFVDHKDQPFKRQPLADSDFETVIRLLLEDSGISLDTVDVQILSRDDMKAFRQLIESFPEKTIANYLAYRFVMSKLESLGFFFKGFFRSRIVPHFLAMATKGKPKWEECVLQTLFHLGPLLSHQYVSHYIADSLNALGDIFYIIQNVTLNILDDTTWLDASTKNDTILHILSMILPTESYKLYSNVTFFSNLYERLEFHHASFFGNLQEKARYKSRYYTKDLLTEGFKNLLNKPPPLVPNAYVDGAGQLIVGAGFIDFPFISAGRPKTFDSVLLGYIIGHEFVHAMQRIFDKIQMSSRGMPAAYQRYQQCVSKHYSGYKYQFSDAPLAGNRSFPEDSADLLGIEIAYRAFKQAKLLDEENGFEIAVLGVEATVDQLFFILFAQYYCQPMGKHEEMMIREEGVPHSPNRFRILGSVSNSERFAEAFRCSDKSPLNPKEKCAFIH